MPTGSQTTLLDACRAFAANPPTACRDAHTAEQYTEDGWSIWLWLWLSLLLLVAGLAQELDHCLDKIFREFLLQKVGARTC